MPLPLALPALTSLTGGGALTPSNTSSAHTGPLTTGAVNIGGNQNTLLIVAAVAVIGLLMLGRK